MAGPNVVFAGVENRRVTLGWNPDNSDRVLPDRACKGSKTFRRQNPLRAETLVGS